MIFLKLFFLVDKPARIGVGRIWFMNFDYYTRYPPLCFFERDISSTLLIRYLLPQQPKNITTKLFFNKNFLLRKHLFGIPNVIRSSIILPPKKRKKRKKEGLLLLFLIFIYIYIYIYRYLGPLLRFSKWLAIISKKKKKKWLAITSGICVNISNILLIFITQTSVTDNHCL